LLTPLAATLALAARAVRSSTRGRPRSLGRRVERRVEAERRGRRRRRFQFGLGFASATATAAAVLVLVLGGGSDSTPGTKVEFANLPQGVHIWSDLQQRPWGTEVSVYVHGMH